MPEWTAKERETIKAVYSGDYDNWTVAELRQHVDSRVGLTIVHDGNTTTAYAEDERGVILGPALLINWDNPNDQN